MSVIRLSACMVMITVLGACSTSRTATAPAAEAVPEGTTPTPYTAEQIRDANPPGTRLVYRLEELGAPPMIQTMVFGRGDAERSVLEQSTATEAGEPVSDPVTIESTWTELRDHAAFPADSTTRTEATCTVPAGTFRCYRYEVETEEDGARLTSVFFFARARPGPPVLYQVHNGPQRMLRMVLLEDSRR